MLFKLAFASLLVLVVQEECWGKEMAKNPPKEKEMTLIRTKLEHRRNRYYRSVMDTRPKNTADYYKLENMENVMDTNMMPFDDDKIILGDPNVILQRKRWRRRANPTLTDTTNPCRPPIDQDGPLQVYQGGPTDQEGPLYQAGKKKRRSANLVLNDPTLCRPSYPAKIIPDDQEVQNK